MCTPASSWFTVFTSEPMPAASPRRNTLAEVAARMLSAAAKALGEPEAMKVSSPDSARARPPDIGASSSSWPRLGQPLAERAGEGRRHGGALHDQAALAQRRRGAALAEQHRFDLLVVDHGDDHDVGGSRPRRPAWRRSCRPPP